MYMYVYSNVLFKALPYFDLAMGMPSGDAQRALSDEELKSLEGMERANVEARIALLRNVQKLLDTAVTQLNQYSVVMAAMGYAMLYIVYVLLSVS